MQTRTWPYGTIKSVNVRGVKNFTDGMQVIVLEEPGTREAFVLHQLPQEIASGDSGKITFTQGGPTGGYWEFSKDE